jgi:hypothetical protein
MPLRIRALYALTRADALNIFFEPRDPFLRERTVFLVGLNKRGSENETRESLGPLLIEVQAQLRSYARMRLFSAS